MSEILIGNKFGYTEMYEWAKLLSDNVVPFGKFVQFNKERPFTIEFANNTDNIIGITSINSAIESDNPEYWPYTYLFNEYGDIYLQKHTIAEAKKEYDELEELSYIRTSEVDSYKPIKNELYNENEEYIPRTHRPEWVKVTILGKAILEDNGECKAGEYCTLYTGDDLNKLGTAVPAKESDKFKVYVMNRVSDKTILVFFK